MRVYAGLRPPKDSENGCEHNAYAMQTDDVRPQLETAPQPSGEVLRPAGGAAISVLSQRGFLDVVHQEIDWVARSGESSMMLMLQPDHLNTAHAQALQHIGQAVCESLRPQDRVGLIDHQVFGVVLHDCQADHGLDVAQRLQALVRSLKVPDIRHPLTSSIGAAFAPLWVRSEVSVWMARVLAQLMAAQSRGGNCICVDSRYLSALSTHDAAGQYLSASTIEIRSAPATGLH